MLLSTRFVTPAKKKRRIITTCRYNSLSLIIELIRGLDIVRLTMKEFSMPRRSSFYILEKIVNITSDKFSKLLNYFRKLNSKS